MPNQISTTYPNDWLKKEADRLFAFLEKAPHEVLGFSLLDGMGNPQPNMPMQVYNCARLTHVTSLEFLRGNKKAGEMADNGIKALQNAFYDQKYGGFYAEVGQDGEPTDSTKKNYDLAHVLLAASSATIAGRPGVEVLLHNSLQILDEYFWEDEFGLCRESWNRDWSRLEDYRGANSNMHMVEALLAVGDATGQRLWHDRALQIADSIINIHTRQNNWRLVEHFTDKWKPLLDYNMDQPSHPFRPPGSTVGHWLEWSRLLISIYSSINSAPEWLKESAEELFSAATKVGWGIDGKDGFIYTLDWDDKPLSKTYLHWVLAEAIGAAAVLFRLTQNPEYFDWFDRFMVHAEKYYIDNVNGSWHHELDEEYKPASTVWGGKPDLYHAYQAVLVPTMPITSSIAKALKEKQS